jgi:hypothetical protein
MQQWWNIALKPFPLCLPVHLPDCPPRRLLQQPNPALRQLPQRCLQQLLAFARRPGQGQSDIVRRSGGCIIQMIAVARVFLLLHSSLR